MLEKSATPTAIHLGCSSPNTSSSLPESRADHAIGFLFGLAPSGVYLATQCYHARGALLPHPFTLTGCTNRGRHTLGGLPARSGQRRTRLRDLLQLPFAVVFFEAPHRIESCLADLATLAPKRRLMIGREMTKRHETYRCDTPENLLQFLQEEDQLRGEFVCVLQGKEVSAADAEDVRNTMKILSRELPPTQAARIGAQLCGLSKGDLYPMAVELAKQA